MSLTTDELAAFDAAAYDNPSSKTSESPTHHSGPSESSESSDTRNADIPRLRRATDLKVPPPTKWLIPAWLPYAGVAVLVGDEGIGKSLWWVLVASHITTGMASPLLGIPKRSPADVVLILTEDSWSDVRGRLVHAGADLGRVHVVSSTDDGSGSPTFPNDFNLIDGGVSKLRPALVVLDAWLDTVSGGLSVKDTQQARQALHPWKERAEGWGSSILLLTHTNRIDSDDLRLKIGATAALRQKARVMLYAAAPPETKGELYIGPDKANGAKFAPAVAFRIDAVQARPATDDDPGTVPRLKATHKTELVIRDHFATWQRATREAAKPPTADQQVEAWLVTHLEAHGGQAPAEATKEAARAAGHSPERLAGAIKRLGGYVGPGEGRRTPWVYRYPKTSETSESPSNGNEPPESSMSELFDPLGGAA